MKKMITLLSVLFAVVAAAAAFPYGSSALEIQVQEFGRYSIEVNGQTYPAVHGTLQLDQLHPGHYNIRVVRHERRGRGHGAPVVHRTVYRGGVFVPHNSFVRGQFNRNGMRFEQSAPPRFNQGQCGTPEPVGYMAAPQVMHGRAFDGLIGAMRSSSFDRSKLEIAEAALRNNLVTTRQVSMIMREFSFDRYRLDVAKFAYESCVDPENYFRLYQEFTFDSNARALMRYIH